MKSRRWSIALLITVAIAISYLDRQTLPVAVKAIQEDIPITNKAFSDLNIAFLLSYGAMYLVGGRLIDLLGTRRGFFLIMVFWSLACASHGFATGFWMLAASRLLLGLGEGGGFPAATKAVAEWFPVRERSTAMGMINAGTAVGSVIAPPVIALIIGDHPSNWRWVFFVTGAAGLIWTVWWLWDYYPPAQHPRLSEQERDEIREVFTTSPQQETEIRWLKLLSFPQVWGLVGGKFLSDAAWYLYLFWLPKYLFDVRGFDTTKVGYYAWIPYAAAGVGSMLGGSFSSWLLGRGYSLNFSRKVALGASAALMPWVFLVTKSEVSVAIILFSMAFFGQQSWSTLVMTLPADLFPRRMVGAVAGLVGFGGAMGGVVFNLISGRVLDSYRAADQLNAGYQIIFGMSSSFHILAFILILITIRRVQPIVLNRESNEKLP